VGEVRADVRLSNPLDPDGPILELDACVDTGAVMVLVGRDIIDRLGIAVTDRAVVTLADDSKKEMDRAGPVRLQVGDRIAHLDVLVGPVGCEALVGQLVLEALDLIVDSQRRQLRPRPSSPAFPSFKMK